MSDVRRLMALSMPPALAKEVAEQIDGGGGADAVLEELAEPSGSGLMGFGVQTVEEKLKQRVSVLDYCTGQQRNDILSNTGAMDVSGPWQSALDDLSPNGVLHTGGGTHRLSTAVSTANKSRIRIVGDGARVIEGTPGTAALITLTSCARAWVHDIHFISSETYAYFSANSPTVRHRFLVITGAEAPRVENVTGENKRGHIFLSGCTGAIVEKSHFVGFFQNVSLGAQANANQCPSVEFSGGANNKALYCYARNHGSCVLWGADGEAPLTVGCDGHDLHDNGVYLSSGRRGRLFGNDFKAVAGSVVKTRGTGNISFGNGGTEAVVGISMTGNGTTPDAYGANGFGNISALNSFDTISGDGISALVQDDLYQRGGVIALNSFTNMTGTGGFGAIRSTMVQGGILSFNAMDGIACDYGILTSGLVGAIQKAHVVFGNSVLNLTGAQQGIRVQYATESLLGGNVGTGTPALLQARNVTDSIFLANVNPNGTYAIASSAANGNSNNLVVSQRGVSSVAGATHPGTGNFPASSAPALTDIPKLVTQTIVVGGIGYIATGISATTDWKQITNP